MQKACAPHDATGCHGNMNYAYFLFKHRLILKTIEEYEQ